ncbi:MULTISPECIES: hypothetical protein [Paenibacillaceae]|uniref:Uncharacterized protein n=1 Tax=Cohnella xylanilytica TaxID=557555 RepID=A0A841TX42_9BACL|nr:MULTISPECIES: hypothetical protein [Paenibacillaceae]MBB6690723.1 hypothetical protein [Cohnella xylanilytica]
MLAATRDIRLALPLKHLPGKGREKHLHTISALSAMWLFLLWNFPFSVYTIFLTFINQEEHLPDFSWGAPLDALPVNPTTLFLRLNLNLSGENVKNLLRSSRN